MKRKNWKKIKDEVYEYELAEDISFRLEFAPKEIRVGEWENRWLLSGHIDNTTWSHEPMESALIEEAMQEAEKEILNVISRQMKYHLNLGNKLAELLAVAI